MVVDRVVVEQYTLQVGKGNVKLSISYKTSAILDACLSCLCDLAAKIYGPLETRSYLYGRTMLAAANTQQE